MTPLLVQAIVTDEERPMIVAGAEQLSAAVADAAGAPFPIRLRFTGANTVLAADLTITSLALDLQQAWDTERRSAFWSARSGPTLLCNLFRHVPHRREHPEVIARIRQLNMFAIRLSRERDVTIVDLDRLFALVGARALADHGNAASVGGREIAETVLRQSLVARLSPVLQGKAIDCVRAPT